MYITKSILEELFLIIFGRLKNAHKKHGDFIS